MDYSAKFKTDPINENLAFSKSEQGYFQKQNDMIFVLDQDFSAEPNRNKNKTIRTILNTLGFGNTIHLHLGMKCRLAAEGVFMTLGNSYLSFEMPGKENDAVHIKTITIKTFTYSAPVKKGFIIGFNAEQKMMEDIELDEEIIIEYNTLAFKNQFLVKLHGEQKMRIEILLSNDDRFHSKNLTKKQIEEFTLFGNEQTNLN